MPYKWKLVLTANSHSISTQCCSDREVKGYCRITSCYTLKCCLIVSWLSNALSMPYKWKLILTAYCCCISTQCCSDREVKGYHTVTSCLRSKCCLIVTW